MTKRDFIAAAAALNDLMNQTLTERHDAAFVIGLSKGVEQSANAMADVFANANPRFNRAQFLTACGL